METINFKKQLYNLPITPFHGNDFLYIGMPLEQLDDILRTHFAIYGEQSNTGYCLTYWIKLEDKIRIKLNILKQKIYRIEFLTGYNGATIDGIRIGSTVKELCDSRNDIYFDEQYILVGKYPYELVIEIDNNDNTIYSLEEVYNNKITKIIVENREILNTE